MLTIISGLTIGAATLLFWALAMFTDTWIGQTYLSITSSEKNGVAFIAPMFGLGFFIISIALIIDAINPHIITLSAPLAIIGVACVILGIVGHFPITFPAWMYPEWHARRRVERRIERARLSGAPVRRGRHAASPPEATPSNDPPTGARYD